jgi:hypothetical protein
LPVFCPLDFSNSNILYLKNMSFYWKSIYGRITELPMEKHHNRHWINFKMNTYPNDISEIHVIRNDAFQAAQLVVERVRCQIDGGETWWYLVVSRNR